MSPVHSRLIVFALVLVSAACAAVAAAFLLNHVEPWGFTDLFQKALFALSLLLPVASLAICSSSHTPNLPSLYNHLGILIAVALVSIFLIEGFVPASPRSTDLAWYNSAWIYQLLMTYVVLIATAAILFTYGRLQR